MHGSAITYVMGGSTSLGGLPVRPGGACAGGPGCWLGGLLAADARHLHLRSRLRAVGLAGALLGVTVGPPRPDGADQLAASQISAATRIATKNTTTMTAAGIVRSLWSCLCTSVLLAVDGAGPARQASLEPLRWRLRLPRAALTVAEPTLVRSGVAPRALWGQVPGDPAGPACRAAARLAGSWSAWPAAPLVWPAGGGFRPPWRAPGARRRQGEPLPRNHARCPVLAVPPPGLAGGAARRAGLSGEVVPARAAAAALRRLRR
jgi:hypothetical protein